MFENVISGTLYLIFVFAVIHLETYTDVSHFTSKPIYAYISAIYYDIWKEVYLEF